jgi:N-acetyl-gamma-glutamyl-phosphate reductase
MSAKKKIGVLGASGYTGADAVRLLTRHPEVEITALTANTHAGKAMGEVFPHFFMLDLPVLTGWEEVDWTALDAVFCGLPHGTTQEIIAAVLKANPGIRILDMSADFRLRDQTIYAQWYGHEHRAPELQGEAVYGLTEFYREQISAARLVACPGCYPTAALLALVPIVKAGLVDAHDLVIDAKSGVTALFDRRAPARARDRPGNRRRRGRIHHGQFHAASDPDGARRALHLLCPARWRRR